MTEPYTPTEIMTVVAARALRNDDVCFVGIGAPSAACNLARLTHAPDITLIYEVRHHRHQARRAAAVDRRRRTVRDGADHRPGAGDVPLLAAGRADHRRLPRRRPDRPLRQPQHHGRRRLRPAQGAASRRRRRPGDRHPLRRDLHHHGDVEARLRRQARPSSPRSATARAGKPRGARRQDQGPDAADHRPLRAGARRRDPRDDGGVDPSRRRPATSFRRTAAGRSPSPTAIEETPPPTDNELGVLRELHARTRRAHGGEDA